MCMCMRMAHTGCHVHMHMHVHMHIQVHMHMQVTGVDLEDKAELLKLCKQLGGTVAHKNADAATVTLIVTWIIVHYMT